MAEMKHHFDPIPQVDWKPGMECYNTLLMDQCHRGFDHTSDEIVLWLCRCSPEAINDFQRKWAATFAELKLKGRA